MHRFPALLAAACTLAALIPATAGAFEIDKAAAFHGIDVDAGAGIHEAITSKAMGAVKFPHSGETAGANLILNVQRGVENADWMHQFDSETHFDNSSMKVDDGQGFTDGFDRIAERLDSAASLAEDNPQFLHPTFSSFHAIAADVDSALTSFETNPECIVFSPISCLPTAISLVPDLSYIVTDDLILNTNENPDPHDTTNPDSPFSSQVDPLSLHMALLAPWVAFTSEVAALYRALPDQVRTVAQDLQAAAEDDDVRDSIGTGVADALDARMTRDLQAMDAYLAFQDLGHAMHSTQDFFAHSNYVELKAGVPVGTAITSPAEPKDLPVPSFAHFDLDGLKAILDPPARGRGGSTATGKLKVRAKFPQLQTGAVVTIWLDEGDYCVGDGGVFSLFNPKTNYPIGAFTVGPWKVGPFTVAGQEIVSGFTLPALSSPGVTLPALGHNPRPPRGFDYCHYKTSTTAGLNHDSDKPEGARSSHVNFAYARSAAERETANLWTAFLGRIGA